MSTVLYCNINEMLNEQIDLYLQILPVFMAEEVRRYKYQTDQKSRLLARLMLKQSLKSAGLNELIYKWGRDKNNKPFITDWCPFNISHSSEMVIFGYGDTIIGLDIEKKIDLDYQELIDAFHPSEQSFIRMSSKPRESFFEIWVKKEAFLKAIGIGIINGLKKFNCMHDYIDHECKRWYFYNLDINPEYVSYLCCDSKEVNFYKQHFQLENLT